MSRFTDKLHRTIYFRAGRALIDNKFPFGYKRKTLTKLLIGL